ncbi:MAG: GAF domain-containing protein, partial [Chloroflexota bacterium]
MSNQLPPFPERKIGVGKIFRFSQPKTWVNRLTYPQKFVLITLIFILPLIAFQPLVAEQSTYIDRYGHKEAQGTIFLRTLWQTTNDLQTLQYSLDEYTKGFGQFSAVEKAQANAEDDFQKLASLHQQYGKSLGLVFDFEKLTSQWQKLKENIKNTSSVESVTNLISSITQLTKEVGDLSYLILDPDLDTYYMMDTVLLKLPENQALLFQIFLHTDEIVRNKVSTPEQEAQLTTLIGLLESNLDAINSNIKTATSIKNNPSGAMLPLVEIPQQNYLNSSRSFVNSIKAKLINSQLTQTEPESLDSAYNETIQTSNAFYNGASQALELGIQTRITGLSTRLSTVLSIAVAGALIAFVIGLLTMRSISNPLVQLISATNRLAAGEMNARVLISRNDEVGQVAQSFNLMADELQADHKAAESRTHDLEITQRQSERRVAQLQAVTELSEAIAHLEDLGDLLITATQLISSRFGFYHVGIFLVNSEREYVVLQATNSEGGQRMLARNHQLSIGKGVVGYTAQTGNPRIALDIGADAVFFDNPDLPDTRSEVALPLQARGNTFGVLDVQSEEADAFSNEDLRVLSALANQVAIALENARLLTETRGALAQVQEVYNEFTRAEWGRAVSKAEQVGFRYHTGRIEMLEKTLNSPEVASAVEFGKIVTNQLNGSAETRSKVAVPVKLRGEVIGILHIESNDPSKIWQSDEVSLVEAVAERAAIAMENARLFQDARRRAAKERLISEAT